MWTNISFYLKAAGILSAAFLVFSCTETKTETKEVPPAPVQKKKGVVYQPSELAQTMRKMYVNMELVNSYLDSNQSGSR